MTVVTEPGIYRGIPEDDYHADRLLVPELGRSLSQSGAKTLLASPARFAWERDHGRPPKEAFDLGGVVHARALRSHDNRIRVADTTDWRLKRWQEWRRGQYAAGLTPVHRGQLREAAAIARKVRQHPLAGAILSVGEPEMTAYAIDPETGITLRARFDWVHPGKAIVDLKSAAYGRGTADVFGKSAASFDYPMQAAHYRNVWHLVTGEWLPFVTITVEIDPPHFVTVGYYRDDDLAVGAEKMRRACHIYAERESSGQWEDDPEIVAFDLPGWYGRTA